MRLDLLPHPSTANGPANEIRVEVERQGVALSLSYNLKGDFDRIRIPPARAPLRADELWLHTCFEVFLKSPAEDAYLELNFSPGGEWAAYRFERYRSGRTELEIPAPSISGQEGDGLLARRFTLEGLPSHRRWSIGLSAIVEDSEGERSFWALAHPPGEPDFHHPDCFALEFPAAERP
ncbi:MAG: hypothetical protein QOJ91_1724 [Sphingomonadales bacterium]|jgi:hypothetical protein|nr:hypothetical protein [Sphingomonadales bacterium]